MSDTVTVRRNDLVTVLNAVRNWDVSVLHELIALKQALATPAPPAADDALVNYERRQRVMQRFHETHIAHPVDLFLAMLDAALPASSAPAARQETEEDALATKVADAVWNMVWSKEWARGNSYQLLRDTCLSALRAAAGKAGE